MSLVMSIIFAIGLFTLIGLAAWAVVALDAWREVPPPTQSLDTSDEESRELVGQHAG